MPGGKDFKSKDLLNLCSGHFTLKIPMVGNDYHGMGDPSQCSWKCRCEIFREPLEVPGVFTVWKLLFLLNTHRYQYPSNPQRWATLCLAVVQSEWATVLEVGKWEWRWLRL